MFRLYLEFFLGVRAVPGQNKKKADTKLTIVMGCQIFTESAQWADLVSKLRCPPVCLFFYWSVCAIGCSFLQLGLLYIFIFLFLYICPLSMQFLLGLSLALRSYDQFKATHWSTLYCPPAPSPPIFLVMPDAYIIDIGASIRISQKSWCPPYAGFFEGLPLSASLFGNKKRKVKCQERIMGVPCNFYVRLVLPRSCKF